MKVGNVCTPSFSILCQRCELFIRGSAYTHSLHTCRICVASESLPSCSRLPLTCFPGRGANPGEHERVGTSSGHQRAREPIQLPLFPRSTFERCPALGFLMPWPRKNEPVPPLLPSPRLLLSGKRIAQGWHSWSQFDGDRVPKEEGQEQRERGVTLRDHRESPGPQARLTSSLQDSERRPADGEKPRAGENMSTFIKKCKPFHKHIQQTAAQQGECRDSEASALPQFSIDTWTLNCGMIGVLWGRDEGVIHSEGDSRKRLQGGSEPE